MIPRVENEQVLTQLNKFFPSRKYDFIVSLGPRQALVIIDSKEDVHIWLNNPDEANDKRLSDAVLAYVKAEGLDKPDLLKKDFAIKDINPDDYCDDEEDNTECF
jgi:hypothetical protein